MKTLLSADKRTFVNISQLQEQMGKNFSLDSNSDQPDFNWDTSGSKTLLTSDTKTIFSTIFFGYLGNFNPFAIPALLEITIWSFKLREMPKDPTHRIAMSLDRKVP